MKLIKFIATKEQLEELSNVLINRIQQMNVVESEYKQFIKSEFNISEKEFKKISDNESPKYVGNGKEALIKALNKARTISYNDIFS